MQGDFMIWSKSLFGRLGSLSACAAHSKGEKAKQEEDVKSMEMSELASGAVEAQDKCVSPSKASYS